MIKIEVAYHRMNSDGNLTRCYRTIWSLCGATTIHLVSSKAQLRKRYLFSAKDKHSIIQYRDLSSFFATNKNKQIIIFETNGKKGLSEFKKDNIRKDVIVLLFGGESDTIPLKPYRGYNRYRIETANRLCLINDVVTGITLYTVMMRLKNG